MEPYELRAIRKAADEILAGMTPEHCPNEAINWADLRCVEVRHYINDRGETGIAAVIEEASPNAGRLCLHVATELHKRGWSGVEVSAEW